MNNNRHKVLVLGASGLFGSLLCEQISRSNLNIDLVLSSRSWHNLNELKKSLDAKKSASVEIDILNLDIHTSKTLLSQELTVNRPDILVNCAGPYQSFNTDLISICVDLKINYIDLADDSDFVFSVPSKFNAKAQANNVSVITGASSVPALSSAFFMHLKKDFDTVDSVDIAITPGNKTPRGLATTQSVMSYIGKSFETVKGGKPHTVYGWQNLRSKVYPVIGKRYLGNCCVPDLKLFPKFFPEIKNLSFQAGLELPFLHLGLYALSFLSRFLPINLTHFSPSLLKMSNWFANKGTNNGAMHVEVKGRKIGSKNITSKTAYLIVLKGDGPYVPTLASFILIKKMILGQVAPGAKTGFNILTLTEFELELNRLNTKITYK